MGVVALTECVDWKITISVKDRSEEKKENTLPAEMPIPFLFTHMQHGDPFLATKFSPGSLEKCSVERRTKMLL